MNYSGHWVERTIQSGPIGEITRYWQANVTPVRSDRTMESDPTKIYQNQNSRAKQLARLLNANFEKGDCCFALTISPENLEKLNTKLPPDLPDNEHQDALYNLFSNAVRDFLGNFRSGCREHEKDTRYITVVSDMDGATGETVRLHAHMIAPKGSANVIIEKWKLGNVHIKWLDEPDYFPLAKYLVVQVRHRKNAKGYTPSRNLIRPQPVDCYATSDLEIQLPAGAQMLYRADSCPGDAQYLRFRKANTSIRDNSNETYDWIE